MAFQFRLQQVLELRSRGEREAAGRLATARGEAQDAQDAHAALEEVRAAGSASLLAAGAAPRAVAQLQAAARVLEHLDRHLVMSEQTAVEAQEKADASLLQYRDALRDRRVLDRLRDRHLEEWTAGEVQADRVEMDEVALARFAASAAIKAARSGTGG
jgi:flagellar FliJ protein